MTQDTQKNLTPDLKNHLGRVRLWTGVSLWIERITRAFWPLFYWCLCFALLWITLPAIADISDFILRASSFVFYAGLIGLFVYGAARFQLPRKEEIEARLEQSPRARHKPLSSLKDTLSNPEKEITQALWSERIKDLLPILKKLRARAPQPLLPEKDPFALRMALVVALLCAVIVTGPTQSISNLQTSLWPFERGADLFGRTKLAEMIVIPPDYTALDALKITGIQPASDDPVSIPAGSTFEINVKGGIGTPHLLIGDQKTRMAKTGDGVYVSKGTITPGRQISVQQLWRPRLSFAYTLIPDMPPEIAQSDNPKRLQRGELQIPLSLTDDYGVRNLYLQIDLKESDPKPLIGEAYNETRRIMSKGGAEPDDVEPIFDLTFHPWAGRMVTINIIASDALNQKAVLAPFEVLLPEKPFYNETARAIIELRKLLIAEPENSASSVQAGLIEIFENLHLYQGDKIVFLGLSSAIYRLQYDPSIESAKSLVDLLWNIAVHIEDGQSGQEYKTLEQAMRALEETLADPNSTQEEIAERMADMQRALANYLQQVAQDMAMQMSRQMQSGDPGAMMQMQMLSNMITPQDMMQFLQEMQREALSGDKNAARDMLSRLSELMQAMRPGAMSSELPQDIQDMQEQLEALRALTQDQKDLRYNVQDRMQSRPDFERHRRTREALENIPGIEEMLKTLNPELQMHFEPPSMSINTQGEADQQNELLKRLEQLKQQMQDKIGQVPQNCQSAGTAMGQAFGALSQNNPSDALIHQDTAIQELENAQNQMQQQMMQRLQQMMGMSFGGMPRLDPFGRPMENGDGRLNPLLGREVKIPDEAERRKIDDILETLRKRSGEFSRPSEERDYFKRLLERF